MENILITLKQIIILAVEIGIGYSLAKREKIMSGSLETLTFLCANVAMPCAIILAMLSLEHSPDVLQSLSEELMIIIASSLLQICVCFRLFRNYGSRQRSVYQMATVYGNSAFMGIPIASAVIGERAVIYVTLLMIFDTIFLFIHASLAMPGEKLDLRMLAKKICNSVTIAFCIGSILFVTGIRLPSVISVGMNDFKGMLTPLAMIIIGTQLANQNLKSIFNQKEYYGVAIIKLLVWPAVIILFLLPFRNFVSSAIIMAVVICKATPQAAVLGVIASNNGLDGKAASGIVGLNTILSALTLPLITGIGSFIY